MVGDGAGSALSAIVGRIVCSINHRRREPCCVTLVVSLQITMCGVELVLRSLRHFSAGDAPPRSLGAAALSCWHLGGERVIIGLIMDDRD
jgi:hypothetical protein